MGKISEIKFSVQLDENQLPETIDWETRDGSSKDSEKSSSKSVLIAIWDKKESATLRIDLWTKDMSIDEMKQFYYQSLLSMADTFKKATGEDKITEDLKDYCAHFAEKMGLISQN